MRGERREVLREISGVRQDQAQVRRRWFQDDYLDLFLWVDPAGRLIAFQLAYDRAGDEHLLEWEHERGYLHRRVDDSRSGAMGIRGTPMLALGKRFPKYRVLTQFDARSATLGEPLRGLIRSRLVGFLNRRPAVRARPRRRPYRAHRF